MRIGVFTILCEAFDAAGNSLIAIMSQPLTIYQRKDGSYYAMMDGHRKTIARQDDGSFYLAKRNT